MSGAKRFILSLTLSLVLVEISLFFYMRTGSNVSVIATLAGMLVMHFTVPVGWAIIGAWLLLACVFFILVTLFLTVTERFRASPK